MTIEEIRARVASCIIAIKAHDYFVHLWVKHKHARDINEIDDVEELLKPFQEFWDKLPNTKAVRRVPFYQICDLAEWYAFGLPNEDDEV